MNKNFLIFILTVVFNFISFSSYAISTNDKIQIEKIIYHYINAVQQKNIIELSKVLDTKDINVLQLYYLTFKAINQKLLKYKIKKIEQFGDRAIVMVNSKWSISKSDGKDSYESEINQVFLVQHDKKRWVIKKIMREENFELIVKNYFLKKNNTNNIKKSNYSIKTR